MVCVLECNLSNLKVKIIEVLYYLRGLQCKQVAAMVYPNGTYTRSQEKNISNYLRGLEEEGLVVSYRPKKTVSNASVYYLSRKGYELAQHVLNVEEGHYGEGWVNENGCSDYGDFSYETYVPPLEQMAHLLDWNELIIKLKSLPDYPVEYRTNFYCSVTFETEEGQYRLRPDGEIRLGTDNQLIYAIEIDRGTESHTQLYKKFQAYKKYYDSCKKNGVKLRHAGILFVVKSKTRENGIKRRWKNLISAFFKGIGCHHSEVNLILTSLDQVTETLLFELSRQTYEAKVTNLVASLLNKEGYEQATSYAIRDNKGKVISVTRSHAIRAGVYDIIFNAVSHPYETRLYSRFLNFDQQLLEKAKNEEIVSGLTYNGCKKNVFYVKNPPFLIENFEHYHLDEKLVKILNELHKNATFYDINELD